MALQGHLTAVRGKQLLEAVCTAPWGSGHDLVVDLSGLSAIDPAGANALLDAYVTMTLRAGSFRLTGLNPQTRAAISAVSGPRLVAAIESGTSGALTH